MGLGRLGLRPVVAVLLERRVGFRLGRFGHERGRGLLEPLALGFQLTGFGFEPVAVLLDARGVGVRDGIVVRQRIGPLGWRRLAAGESEDADHDDCHADEDPRLDVLW